MSAQRRFRMVLPALLLGLAIPGPMAAPTAPVDLVGALQLLHGEDFETGAPSYDYPLQTARGRVALRFDGEAPDGFVNGATVRVKARRDGSTLVAADGTANAQVLASAPGWSGQRKLAVILMNFSNNGSRPFSRAYANGVVFTNPNSVRAYYAEQSHGTVVLQGATFDWVRVPYPSTSCQPRAWEAAAKAALTARGVDLTTYTNFMFLFPPTTACRWGGLGQVPGQSSWINGTPSLRVAAHELGHNLGVQHGSALRCTKNGVRVALSTQCTRREYGDPFTTMGSARTRHLTNLELVQIGYLPPEATRTVVASGTYALTSASASSGVRIIAIPRGDGTSIYLEYRRPYGTYFDNFSSTSSAVRGVAIRLGGGWTTITQSLLIDTIPSTTSFADAPLRLGRTFRDFRSGASIYVSALGRTSATVRITMPPDTSPPSGPGAFVARAASATSVDLAWTSATDNRAVAAYRIWRDGVLVATTPGTATRLTDAGLTTETAYAYRIRAVDAAGNLGSPGDASATTLPSDLPPSTPNDLTVTVSATSATLLWSPATDDVGVAGYRLWQNGVYLGMTSERTFTIDGLTPASPYRWSVQAIDTAGHGGYSARVEATTGSLDVDGSAPPPGG